MKRILRWVISNGLFAVVLYFAYFEKINGAENIALFYAWFTIVFSFAARSDAVIKSHKYKKRIIPSWLNFCFDAGVTAVFVWFGAWITGIFYFIHIFLLEAVMAKIKDAHNQATNADAKKTAQVV